MATIESMNLTTSDNIFLNIVTSCKSQYEVTFTTSGDIMKTTSSEIHIVTSCKNQCEVTFTTSGDIYQNN